MVGGNPQIDIVEPAQGQEDLIFNISVTNEVPELRRLRREIENTLAKTQARNIAMNVCLAVDEATQNIIRHAFPENMSGRALKSVVILRRKNYI